MTKTLTLNSPTSEWLDLFQRINRDCSKSGESVVPFSDVEYYTEQVYNITDEVDYKKSREIAVALASLRPDEDEGVGIISFVGQLMWSLLPDRCEGRDCPRKGIRGNENTVADRTLCDDCSLTA